MYHYIYSVRYFLIYKNDDVNEKNEKNEKDEKDEKDENSDKENKKAEKINKNKEIKNDNEYHIAFEDMII